MLWEAAVVSRGQGAGCAGARGGAGALAKRAGVLKGECAGYSMAAKVRTGYIDAMKTNMLVQLMFTEK